jgi:hypothetical protein
VKERSAHFGALCDETGGCRRTIGDLFGDACLSQAESLGVPRVSDGCEFLYRVILRKELRLNVAEGALRLLAGFAIGLGHENLVGFSVDAETKRPGKTPGLDETASGSASTSVVKGKQISIYAA